MTTQIIVKDTRKQELIKMLRGFISRPPNLRSRDFETVRDYERHKKAVWRDMLEAELLISYIEQEPDILYVDMTDRLADSGARLELVEIDEDGTRQPYKLIYTPFSIAGLEFRSSVCMELSLIIWRYWRRAKGFKVVADFQAHARKLFGRSIARKYFQ